jgi:hypothetical protein
MGERYTGSAEAASVRASYEWEKRSDEGETAIEVRKAAKAKTTLAGIPIGMAFAVRFRAKTKDAMGDLGQAVAFRVRLIAEQTKRGRDHAKAVGGRAQWTARSPTSMGGRPISVGRPPIVLRGSVIALAIL